MDFRRLRSELAAARNRKGLTLDAAAAASGLNRATIHSIENVKREPDLKPGLETIERLAIAYGLTLAGFFGLLETRYTSRSKGAGSQKVSEPQGAGTHGRAVSPTIAEEELSDAGARIVRTVITEFERVAAAQRALHETTRRQSDREQHPPKSRRRAGDKG